MEISSKRMSDIISGKGGIVFGTAGHIDHGKTTLVRALTGINTDRLAEEQKRGISIELGFANLALPNNQNVALIDVPGHERFIKNMLAGTGGIDAVLLVVASDEGIKPQTREHFEICRLLGISEGLIILTKADLVSQDRAKRVETEVRDFCAGKFLQNAACVAVSAHTGLGIKTLVSELSGLATRLAPRAASSYPRLPVDRSFAMQGFGTVVTRPHSGGSLRPGDTVEIHPMREQFRIRGIQVHGSAVPEARAGQRTAVNLAGVEAKQIERGAVLTPSNIFETTAIFDAVVDWLDPKYAARVRQSLRLYAGCVESVADVRLLGQFGKDQTLTRISSREPLLLLPEDRFVLRNAETTVGGGRVIDPAPPIRLNREKTRHRLTRLTSEGEAGRLALLVEEGTQGRKIGNVVKVTGWTPAKIKKLAEGDKRLHICEAEQRIVSVAWLEQKREQVLRWLGTFHQANPAAAGAPMHQIRSTLLPSIEPTISDFILRSVPQLAIAGETVSLLSHAPKLSSEETATQAALEKLFRAAGFQPPLLKDALAQVGKNPAAARTQLEALIKAKKLVRISADTIFHADVLEHVKRSLAAQKGRRFSVPEFKEWTGVSRKYAIPLLEFLDRERVTRREGDTRVVL